MQAISRTVLAVALLGAVSAAILARPALSAGEENAVPDFSGVWWRNAMDPELPPAGAAPLVNLRRPYNDQTANGGGDPIPLVGDYNNPILKPNAIEAVKKAGELSAGGRINPDPSNQCAPYSPPYIFTIQLGVQMLQSKDEIVMLYPQDSQIRRVRLNASHPEHVAPSAMGDSIGHYEGDTLVIDTVGVKLGPVTMVDRYGTPQSEAMHLVERYRFVDAIDAQAAMEEHQRRAGRAGGAAFIPNVKALRLDYTVDDSNVFTMPWSARITYRKTQQAWQEQVCAENIVEYWPGMNIGVPKANQPDF